MATEFSTRNRVFRVLHWLAFLLMIGEVRHASGESQQTLAPNELVVEGAILKTIETTAVSSQVSGVISQLRVKEGSTVKSGAEIGKIQDAAVQLQAERAKLSAKIATAKKDNDIDQRLAAKNKAVAENEFLRAVQANNKVSGVYPVNEIDRFKLLFDRAVLEAERAAYQQKLLAADLLLVDIEYRQTLELLNRHRIVAPCNGVVVNVDKRIGEWVEPGTVLITIVQTDRLRIEGFLNANDATPSLLGSMATVKVENSTFAGELSAVLVFISPEANPLNSDVRVFLEVDNSKGLLRPGLRPKTTIHRRP